MEFSLQLLLSPLRILACSNILLPCLLCVISSHGVLALPATEDLECSRGVSDYCLQGGPRSFSLAQVEQAEEEVEALQVTLLQVELLHSRAPPVAQDPTGVVVLPADRTKPEPFLPREGDRLVGQAAIPVGAFLVGATLLAVGHHTAGMLAVYFGGQSSFALYMKLVLSEEVISRHLQLKGMPAAFLVTAMQQVVAFITLGTAMLALYFTPWRYVPRRLTSFREAACVLLFSVAVAVNIGLNNFSMSLLPVSLNLVIRSCIPLVTLVLQVLAKNVLPSTAKADLIDVSLMTAGVVFACVAALAESESKHQGGESRHLLLGVLMCSLSDVAAATTLILASAFSSIMEPALSPLDMILYMAMPCALILLPASMYASHPVDWPNFGPLTDWEVYRTVTKISPNTVIYVVMSGLISAGYNFIQYSVVQKLSASHAAFAGNFNKAATISLSMCFGLEKLPGDKWNSVLLLGIIGNIIAFTTWSYLQSKPAAKTERF